MKKAIIGGIITLVIGGTGYTISQSDVVSNFAKNTGMSQQQAQQYVNNSQNNLASFSKVGQDFVSDGNSLLNTSIDCQNYTYEWVTSSLSCEEGKSDLQTIGNDEVQLGYCYQALGTDLGSASRSKISECINDIDAVDTSYDLPLAVSVIGSSKITDLKNNNLYNKSVLQSALNSN